MSHKKLATAAAVALVSLGASASAASAGTITPTDGTPAFTASSAATHTFTVKGGSGVISSTSSTFNGTTTSPASSTATVNPVYSGVSAKIVGINYPAAVTVSGPWTITSTNSTSPFTGNVTTSATTTVTISGLSGSLVVPSQTKGGLTGINSGANAALGAAVSGLNWTASGNVGTFLGATSGTDGTYSSNGQSINVVGVNIVP